MLKFSDRQAKDFIAHGVQVSQQLLSIFGLEVFKQILNIFLDVRLLVRVTVLLLFDVLHAGVEPALLLPVELLADVSSCNRYWQVVVYLSHDVV